MTKPNCDCHGEPMYWHKNTQLLAGGRWRCRVESRERSRRYRASHPDQGRSWVEANGDRIRDIRRRFNATTAHGITRVQRDWLYEQQGGHCAGCNEPFVDEQLEVDHDHTCCSGKHSCGECVRGLLCHLCNQRDLLTGVPAVEFVLEMAS